MPNNLAFVFACSCFIFLLLFQKDIFLYVHTQLSMYLLSRLRFQRTYNKLCFHIGIDIA